MALERLHNGRDRGGLLTDGDIDADHVLAFLIDDGVDADGGLARLTVTNNQLALATPNGNHRVNGNETGLHRLVYRLALDNARCAKLDGTMAFGLDGAVLGSWKVAARGINS